MRYFLRRAIAAASFILVLLLAVGILGQCWQRFQRGNPSVDDIRTLLLISPTHGLFAIAVVMLLAGAVIAVAVLAARFAWLAIDDE